MSPIQHYIIEQTQNSIVFFYVRLLKTMIMSNKKKVKFKDVIKSDKPTLVDFYATWCGPCQQLSPIVNSVKKELTGQMKVIKVDVDKNKSVSNKFKIRSLPTLAIFQNGKIIWRESGMKSKTELMNIAKQFINDTSSSSLETATVTKEKASWLSKLFN